jgi:Ca2+-binding RTX toxin-like protein
MRYLNWDGTFTFEAWKDTGSPGDAPTTPTRGQTWGISSRAVWGDSLDVYTIVGTSEADTIFMYRVGFDTPRLINVTQINGAGGNDLIDLTSQQFTYGAVTLNGGTGRDTLLANSGRDRLLGQSGNDQLKGYGGNDYLNGGNNNDCLYGGRGNDKLVGGSGHDYLYGQLGKDTLTGGSGNDRFVFDVSFTKANMDTITDFSVKHDSIHLAQSVFTKAGSMGGLKAKAFWSGSKAHDASDRVIYNEKSGYLYYDADGTGDAPMRAIAKLSKNLEITHKDFFIV